MARVLSCRLSLLPAEEEGMERIHRTDHFFGAYQKIPDCLINITFLMKVKTAVRLVVASRFSIMNF